MEVIAHRGLTHRSLENSTGAVAAAVAAGFARVEVDVRTTRDGGLFLLQDQMLQRTARASGRLSSLTGGQASRVRLEDGSALPSLQSVPELVDGRSTLCLDVKEDDATEPLLSLLSGRDGSVEIWSEHRPLIRSLSAAGFRTTLIAFGILSHGIGQFLWWARDAGAAAVSFFPADLEPHVAAACRNASMPFLCGTPNDEGTWLYLARAGAFAAITDRPIECRRVLASTRGLGHGSMYSAR